MKNITILLRPTFLIIVICCAASVSLLAQEYTADTNLLGELAANERFETKEATSETNEFTALPTFTMGGEYANISQYVADNLVFPETAITTGTSGILKVNIKINADGSVGETAIVQSPGAEFDEAVQSLIADMPKWNPAFRGNKAVDSVYTLQLRFRLQ